MHHPYLRHSSQPDYELSMLYRRRLERREYASRRDRQPIIIRSIDVNPHQKYEMRIVDDTRNQPVNHEEVLVYSDHSDYVLSGSIDNESFVIEENLKSIQPNTEAHDIEEMHESNEIPIKVIVTQPTTSTTVSTTSEPISSPTLITLGDDKNSSDDEDKEPKVNVDNSAEEKTVKTGRIDNKGAVENSVSQVHKTSLTEIPSAMADAPSWAIFLWKQIKELKDTVSENTAAIRRQHQEIFRRAEHLPEGVPFKDLKDFVEFESASSEDFDTLVGYFVNMGRSSAHDCAHDFFKVSFVQDEHVTPHVTTHGKGLHKPRSLLKSRFAMACREAMRMSNKFPPPTDAEFEDVMEKALKATKNRRGTRVSQGLLVSEKIPKPSKKTFQSSQ